MKKILACDELTALRNILVRKILSRLSVLLLPVSMFACTAQNLSTTVKPLSLQVSLELIKQSFQIGETVVVRYRLLNSTDRSIRLLPWGTPLEAPLTADNFQIEFNGEVIPYTGIMVKRSAPAAADYLNFSAGKSMTSDVELTPSYDMRASGEYTIQLRMVSGNCSIGSEDCELASAPLKIVRLDS